MKPTYFSVIIVSWNVVDALRECLLSLGNNSDVEVIVVDNASSDGTTDLVKEFTEVNWQLQNQNLGFAKGCNLGAKVASGEILVFLNPDTIITQDFFSNLANFLSNHEKAGVIGGKILNHDNTIQPSVRNWPSVWSGILDSLKLLARFPKLGKKYLRFDFDYNQAQEVEQVMGACFIVRRELFKKLRGFDERFFVWFEEVDFCLRAVQDNFEVWYTPSIKIEHIQGKSFKQYSYLRRHFNFSKSLVQYIKKHKGVAAALVVLITSVPWFILAPVADLFRSIKNMLENNIPLSTWRHSEGVEATEESQKHLKFAKILRLMAQNDKWGKRLFGNLILTTVLVIILTEILSYLGWRSPLLGSVFAILLTIAWLIVAVRNLSLAVVWLTLELILGGFGYWLSFEVGDLVLSMRMLLFGAGVSLLIYKIVINRALEFFNYKIKWWYGACLLMFGLSVVVANFYGNNSANIILDGQRYLYWLLLPLWFEINLTEFKKYALTILTVGLVWLWLKTSLGLYIFSHYDFEQVKWFYIFWRDTRFAEITLAPGGMWRIFSQSQIYVAMVGVGLWTYNMFNSIIFNFRMQFGWYLIGALSIFTALMSFSRSFWLGMAVALLVIIISFLLKKQLSFYNVIKQSGIMLLIVLAGFGYMFATTRLNWPIKSLSGADTTAVAGRLNSSDAAASSRMKLWGPLSLAIKNNILFGRGLGATVTYFSSDPRRVAQTAAGSGEYTTYAFEWGYLELWLKFGLIGLVVYLGFIIRSLLPIWREFRKGRAVLIGLSAGILVLLITNITTPYLNHALGIGALMLVITLVNKESYATN